MPAGFLALYCLSYFLLAGVAINLGYHRVLSHRSLRLARWLERIAVTLGLPAGTPVQWAGNHRHHHATADRPGDPHSPVLNGFWHAHVGWYIQTDRPSLCLLYSLMGPLRTAFDAWHRPRTNREYDGLARDVAEDPYYAWLSRPGPYLCCTLTHAAMWFGFAFWAWGVLGLAGLWLVSAVVYNLGDAIDSAAHLWGHRPYGSPHHARNHWFLGLFTLGEGWHANHHEFPSSARHGLLPGQPDWTWGMIRLLQRLGWAWDIKLPPPELVRSRLSSSDGASDVRALL